ncbi:hypothetical protein B0T24DRAFT_669684 [Lasiosphaeria ovina]|uniref:Uncharacterized protein n=1 Tax=Lasiosphaeria ovina TaxID=92902 RepID=A0AAE0JZT4_9PEZI|nr:hypothetical protein B0T24DRAFT_669684 [Lasiosphaeria ovina]
MAPKSLQQHPSPLKEVPPESAPRWQVARLTFASGKLPELLRGPPIPWRANIDDCCHTDVIDYTDFPFPVPFFTVQPESAGKAIVKAYYHDNTASTPCGISTSVGGLTYQRVIQLSLIRNLPTVRLWSVTLCVTSRDGDWLASLSRTDAAALVGLDSAIRAVGWVHPNEVGLKNSVMLYAKTLRQPWLEAVDLEPQGDGKPRYETSPLGVAHDDEVRQVMDDSIDKLIR